GRAAPGPPPPPQRRVERRAPVEIGDARPQKAAGLLPVPGDQPAEDGHAETRIAAPEDTGDRIRREHELERRDAATRLYYASELGQGCAGIVDVAEQVGEGEVVELSALEWE